MEKNLFRSGTVCLAVLTGVMIPASVMATSPTEFVIRGHYVSPLVQLIYTFCTAVGLFVLWGNLVFEFASERAKKILVLASVSGSICSLVDFLFFRRHLKDMSMHMLYYDAFSYSAKEILINAAVLAAITIAVFLLIRFNGKIMLGISYIAVVSVTVMSLYHMVSVQSVVNDTSHLKDDEYFTESDVHFTLDCSGRNVIIFMLDRAFGQFVPYILNEKPELRDIYSGFTFYPNTISHGTHTAAGAPALFGGYDYTTWNVKDVEDRKNKVYNESLKVLPKLFSENGFECTVFDPPYYIDLGEGTLEDFYHDIDPDISSYYADGVVKTKEDAKRDYDYFVYAARKDYFRHSIFITAPLLFRTFLYDDDGYLMQERIDERIVYSGHREELDKLSQLTRIKDDGGNTFTIIENDLTHSIDMDLQLPDYTQVDEVDNSGYMEEWKAGLAKTDKETGRDINMYTSAQIQAYQVNMAALLSLGRWISYLKENGLYENTRIILAADHGYYFRAFDDMLFERNGDSTDLEVFTPLLMVKDFGDGDLEVSDEFMTNADVPTIALKDLIDDPVNPYTGNRISSDRKYERPQYVIYGKQWYSIHDDIYDMNNWDRKE